MKLFKKVYVLKTIIIIILSLSFMHNVLFLSFRQFICNS